MTSESSSVWAQIREAFPPVLPPQPVTVCACDECLDVRANFGHLRWDQVLRPAIGKGFGWLPLLTEEAFQALLPAFLFYALQDLREQNKVLEWTLYALCGSYVTEDAESSDPHPRNRAGQFTEAQRAAVRAFLELVASVPNMGAGHRDAIAHGLAIGWV